MGKIYDLARGEVRIKVEGAEPEKVLNYCTEKGIEFWDTSPNRDFEMEMTVCAADYPLLQNLSGKNGCYIELISSKGGKRISRAAKRRYILCLGFAFCVILLALSSLFVWRLDVKGNEAVSDAEIIRALAESGLDYGTFWPAMSSENIRNEILLKFPELAWMSVNVRNSCAEIVVHERVYKPDILNEAEFCDIEASESGIITSMSVLQGKALVSVGDTAAKGDILVTGVMDSETGDTRFVHADARVTARTWHELSAQTPIYETVKTKKHGTKRRLTLVPGKKYINFGIDSRNKQQSCDKINKLRLTGLKSFFTLPLGIITDKSTEWETTKQKIDKNAAIERLKDTLLEELEYRIDGGSINEKKFTVSDDGKLLTVTLRAECTENISKEKVND